MLYLCQQRLANIQAHINYWHCFGSTLTSEYFGFFCYYIPGNIILIKINISLGIAKQPLLFLEYKPLIWAKQFDKTHPLAQICLAGALLTETWVRKSKPSSKHLKISHSLCYCCSASQLNPACEWHRNFNTLGLQKDVPYLNGITNSLCETRKIFLRSNCVRGKAIKSELILITRSGLSSRTHSDDALLVRKIKLIKIHETPGAGDGHEPRSNTSESTRISSRGERN